MLTILYPCYNVSDSIMQIHLQNWKSYPVELRQQLNILLIDDGSRVILDPEIDFPLNLRIARILEDIGWNNGGAKNLGFKLAPSGWVFQSDIDHTLSRENVEKLLSLDMDKELLYHFRRYDDDGGGNLTLNHPHPNSFLIHKERFWSIGGYDEDFSGRYGYEDILFQMLTPGETKILEDIFVTSHPDWATRGVSKRRSHNRRLYEQKAREIEQGTYANGEVLRFEWQITRELSMNDPER